MEHNQQNENRLNSVSESNEQAQTVQLKGQYELILNWYKINGKNLLDEEVLPKLQISTLLKILGNPIWNDIYHCWAIENKHFHDLQPYAEHTFDPNKYSYFIEAYHNT